MLSDIGPRQRAAKKVMTSPAMTASVTRLGDFAVS